MWALGFVSLFTHVPPEYPSALIINEIQWFSLLTSCFGRSKGCAARII
jgi:hypothetical protein